MFGLITVAADGYDCTVGRECLSAVAATTNRLALQYAFAIGLGRHTDRSKSQPVAIFSLVQELKMGHADICLNWRISLCSKIDECAHSVWYKNQCFLRWMADQPAQQAALVWKKTAPIWLSPVSKLTPERRSPSRPEEFADRVTPLYTISRQ